MLVAAISLGVSTLAALLGLIWRFSALVTRFESTLREHERMRSEFPAMRERLSILEASRGGRRKSGGEFG